MKLRFTPRATGDLASIADYIGQRNPATARKVLDAIIASLKILSAFPHIGRQQDVEGVRRFVTPKYAYLVYYTIDRDADEIVLLTIQHPARNREYQDD